MPVLSKMTVSMLAIFSIAVAFLNSAPISAARPIPATIAVGVASPKAHGHAMTVTVTAISSAFCSCGSGAMASHMKNAAVAVIKTNGTNLAETLSTSLSIGALDACARSTCCTICASRV